MHRFSSENYIELKYVLLNQIYFDEFRPLFFLGLIDLYRIWDNIINEVSFND